MLRNGCLSTISINLFVKIISTIVRIRYRQQKQKPNGSASNMQIEDVTENFYISERSTLASKLHYKDMGVAATEREYKFMWTGSGQIRKES